MFIEELERKFGKDVPIFTEEILKMFSRYSRAYVFRLINKAIAKGELARADTGVYYLPTMTILGPSVISASEIARKKYIENGEESYGIYSGLALQNLFSLTPLMAYTTEIVTNKETTRGRRVKIAGLPFIIKKPRTAITRDNANAYCVLQIFSETKGEEICDRAKRCISEYIKRCNITLDELGKLAEKFPARVMREVISSEVI